MNRRRDIIFMTQGETEEAETPDSMVRSVSFNQQLSLAVRGLNTSSMIESSLAVRKKKKEKQGSTYLFSSVVNNRHLNFDRVILDNSKEETENFLFDEGSV